MMDCKKALDETGGDIEAAVDWLRAKGLAEAAKKAGRTAAEGLVGVAVNGTRRRGRGQFRDRLRRQERPVPGLRAQDRRGRARHGSDDVEALKAAAYPGGGTVGEKLTDNVATIGENQQVRRIEARRGRAGRGRALHAQRAGARTSARSACWSRSRARPAPRCSSRSASSSRCTSPRPSRRRSTPTGSTPTVIERERKVAAEKAAESGKPAEVEPRWSRARSRSSPRRTRC